LWVSESGNLVKSFGGETPFSLTKKQYEATRKAISADTLKQLLGLDSSSRSRANILRSVPSTNGVSITALDVPVTEEVGLPVWLFRSGPPSRSKAVILILDSRGRNSIWKEGGLCVELAARGFTVAAADVRGIGDLAPQFSAGAPGYARSHQEIENYAWSSLMLGKPLAGQRVTDILSLTFALRQITGFSSIAIAASGELTVPALFAGALEHSIGGLYLMGGLSLFADILETENYRHSFANFVPGLLKHTDLPEIVGMLAPRRVVLAGPVGGDGQPLLRAAAEQAYRLPIESKHVAITEDRAWDVSAVAAFLSN
jgi:hypothetical protein